MPEIEQKALQKLREFWGYDEFRPGQEEAIASVMAGRDTLVLFPTGGGKSLCYQLPATLLEGMTLVISPLVSLMQDQVEQLKGRGIPATFINSTLHPREVEQRLVNARNGMYRLLYCAPERFDTTLWEAEQPNLEIAMVAVDEAHCISEWGHDFRPAYREIRPSLASLPGEIPWVALTATATPEVRRDIVENLQMEDPAVVARGFDRPNLKWWVLRSEQKDKMLMKSVRRGAERGSGLVYGGTRRNCEELASRIQRELGVEAAAYHAGVEGGRRREIQQRWIEGSLPLVVATSAFGMGIDKADCRYVIHYQPAYTLEAYYQEAGRAGRDGREAYPILLFKPSDADLARSRIRDSWPGREQLQRAYDALCDHLELALGSEMERSRQVDTGKIAKRAGLSERVAASALKVLEQLGVVEIFDYLAPQTGVRFVVSRDYLRQHISELGSNRKADFLDTLYRQYGPESFGRMKFLETDYLSRKLQVGENALVKGLHVLSAHDRLLQYESRGDLPLVRLRDERIARLPYGKEELERHRNALLKKLDYLLGYVHTEGCREVYIRNYFGERNPQPCGHCDNCLDPDKGRETEFADDDLDRLKSLLEQEALTLGEIKKRTRWKSGRLQGALAWLLREEMVETDGERYRWSES